MEKHPSNIKTLNGKWLLKETGYKEFKKNIGLQILYFKNNEAATYTDISLTRPEFQFSLRNSNVLFHKENKYGHFKLLGNDFLRLFVKGFFNDKNVLIEMDFVHMLPTKTTLQKKEIESMEFEYRASIKHKSRIAFNKELWKQKSLDVFGWKEGLKMILEKLDETYFITVFNHGRKGATIPVREVNEQVLKLYCVPGENDEIVATRLLKKE